jgi:hypothetical protein
VTLFHLVAEGAPQSQRGFEPGERLLQVLLLSGDLQRFASLKDPDIPILKSAKAEYARL